MFIGLEGTVSELPTPAYQLTCRKASVARASRPKVGPSLSALAQRSNAPPLNRLKYPPGWCGRLWKCSWIFDSLNGTHPDFSSMKQYLGLIPAELSQTTHGVHVEETVIHLDPRGRHIYQQKRLVQRALDRPVQDPMTISQASLPNGFVTLLGSRTRLLPRVSLPDS